MLDENNIFSYSHQVCCVGMIQIFSLVEFFCLLSVVNCVHFLGGTITWYPLNQSSTGTPVDIVITQTYHWLYTRIACTSAMIAANQLIPLGFSYAHLAPQTLDCIANCANGSVGYVPPSIVPRCINVSLPLGITYTQRSDTIILQEGNDFSAAFRSFNWRPLATAAGADWSISTHIIVRTRSDNSRYNNAPVATLVSPIDIPVNISTMINIPVVDPDGDITRCRWSTNATVNECGETCPPDSLPLNTTIDPNCQIRITGRILDAWYAVTLMVSSIDQFILCSLFL